MRSTRLRHLTEDALALLTYGILQESLFSHIGVLDPPMVSRLSRRLVASP